MGVIVGLSIAYFIGAIPFAYAAGKLMRGIDLREHGSGNLGSTNVYRFLGGPAAAVVLLLDTLKGVLPVLLLPAWFVSEQFALWGMVYGIAAIAGHVRSPFLFWKGGGKGVATAGGVFLALTPIAMGAALCAWLLVLAVSGYVSLASLAAAVVLPVGILLISGAPTPLFFMASIVAAFVFWTHRANMQRLRAGTESRFRRTHA